MFFIASDTKTPRKTTGILRVCGVTQQNQLTPKAKLLYAKARRLKQIAAKFKTKNIICKKRLQFLNKSPTVLANLGGVNDITWNFFLSQQRTQKYKPRGRRFTLEDKIFALSVSKQSGKAYRYLSSIFSLPSRKVLSSLLSKIPFNCGINRSIFDHIKTRVEKLNSINKHCVLMFDEVSLEPGLSYNQKNDRIDGFVDFGGSDRRTHFADHALVFLIKGIHRKWKMPVCFYFVEGTTATSDLVRIIKEVVREIRKTGLHIVSTISDQGATNQAAIRKLLNETNEFCIKQSKENRFQGYVIDGEEIVHIYDFPHLMKGIRNGLLEKDLYFSKDGVQKVASWKHIVKMYEIDKNRGAYSQFVKLTDEHVYPLKIKKMRVKNCTQVFSHTVATAMHVAAKLSSELSSESEYYLDPKAVDTADLLLFFDKLFDSVNGFSVHPSPGKELRTVVTNKSQHILFWQSCIPVLNSMYFYSSSGKHVTPSIKNWSHSLKSLIYLAPKLFNMKFKYFAPRCFNQDPIENFFSCIRSHSSPNTNPTCSSFISSFKSLLLNNFVSSYSVGSNCEMDESEGVLDNLRSFITEQQTSHIDVPHVNESVFPEFQQIKTCYLGEYVSAYVAGFVSKKILKNNKCQNCTDRMCANEELPQNILIRERQYEGCSLSHPSSNFSKAFEFCTRILLYKIPFVFVTYEEKKKLSAKLENDCIHMISKLFCEEHQNLSEIFISATVNIVVHCYINNINKILKGKDHRRALQDPLTKLAYFKCKKRRPGR